ncbi:GcrA family cell cycle regulator [Ancylobacter sp. Lp-2]|uniref:GcrA family cell cycle regulator n=1 Tax=Ancylobacter sp. Lp-2 TaxID=2881339 RepID=UPI001E5F1C02|nr:GcrA family cell cycle regulator [Ancylobacter sp. Lp-2]MCB4767965.1 GcrA family cell cycle regulator [Ancylobacter sp. Lp-2]
MARYTPPLDLWLAEQERRQASDAYFGAAELEDPGWPPAPPKTTSGRRRAGPSRPLPERPAGPETLVPALPPPEAAPDRPSPSGAGADHRPTVSILAREDFQCAWIAGDGEDGFALCCGAPVMRAGLSWCEPHARRVIRPSHWDIYARGEQRTGRTT